MNYAWLTKLVENQRLEPRFLLHYFGLLLSFRPIFPSAPGFPHRHKRPNPAELFPTPKSDTSAIELTPSEALTAVSILPFFAKIQISEELKTNSCHQSHPLVPNYKLLFFGLCELL
ncbi:hypothetical protein QUB25_25765 [Microcoleus sp. B3-D7]